MKPTNKLRFVEREVTILVDEYSNEKGFEIVRKVKLRILQQWWEWDVNVLADIRGEWRDVPLEVEL